jgi:hypothetical protein
MKKKKNKKENYISVDMWETDYWIDYKEEIL